MQNLCAGKLEWYHDGPSDGGSDMICLAECPDASSEEGSSEVSSEEGSSEEGSSEASSEEGSSEIDEPGAGDVVAAASSPSAARATAEAGTVDPEEAEQYRLLTLAHLRSLGVPVRFSTLGSNLRGCRPAGVVGLRSLFEEDARFTVQGNSVAVADREGPEQRGGAAQQVPTRCSAAVGEAAGGGHGQAAVTCEQGQATSVLAAATRAHERPEVSAEEGAAVSGEERALAESTLEAWRADVWACLQKTGPVHTLNTVPSLTPSPVSWQPPIPALGFLGVSGHFWDLFGDCLIW